MGGEGGLLPGGTAGATSSASSQSGWVSDDWLVHAATSVLAHMRDDCAPRHAVTMSQWQNLCAIVPLSIWALQYVADAAVAAVCAV